MTARWYRSAGFVVAAILLGGCAAAADPSVSATSSGPQASCRGADATLEAVIAVPYAERAACFGASEITLRGWVFEELNPAYDCVTANDAMWLRCVTSRQRLIAFQHAPAALDQSPPALWVATDPDGPVGEIRFNASQGPIPVNTWVEVSGHFADPAAEDCGPRGDPGRIDCESVLVVTRVEAIGAPSPTT